MGETRINGQMFENMMHHALAHLIASEKKLNSLNVFPVADGDTGTNMRRTIENAMEMTAGNSALNLYLRELSTGMLLSARGNSGVILSQLFKGVYLELSRCSSAGVIDLRNAFIRAYRVAYDAVVNPVEGTMLTVAREGIDLIKTHVVRNLSVEEFFEMYISEMTASLKRTPELLPVLKESGVLDSGGMGYITIITGMLSCLRGNEMPGIPEGEPSELREPSRRGDSQLDFSVFTEDSEFEEGYCMEFILQRLKTPGYDQVFVLADYIRMLETMGNSLVVVENEYRIKVHIHTKKPAHIISYSQCYGEFLSFKLENMQIQHNEFSAEKVREHKQMVLISVANGEGMKNILHDQGSDYVIDGGKTMSVSAKEFLDIFESVDSDEIIVLPNSSNIFLSAEQAKSMCDEKKDHIHIIHTTSMAEGYFAMAMYMPDEPDIEKRIQNLESGAESVKTLTIARSVKAFSHNNIAFNAGRITVFVDSEPITEGDSAADALEKAFEMVPGLCDCEACVIFSGLNGGNEMLPELEEVASSKMPLADICTLDGGQYTYDFMVGFM